MLWIWHPPALPCPWKREILRLKIQVRSRTPCQTHLMNEIVNQPPKNYRSGTIIYDRSGTAKNDRSGTPSMRGSTVCQPTAYYMFRNSGKISVLEQYKIIFFNACPVNETPKTCCSWTTFYTLFRNTKKSSFSDAWPVNETFKTHCSWTSIYTLFRNDENILFFWSTSC